MSELKKICLIGGDERLISTGREFSASGYEVSIFGFDTYPGLIPYATKCTSLEDACAGCEAIILPLPYTVDKINVNAVFSSKKIPLEDIWKAAEGIKIFGGMMKPVHKNCFDYFEDEELQIANAVPTAEGAIEIAMREMKITLSSCSALVTGYGRISKILAERLYGLKARVTVAARKAMDRAYCEAFGYNSIHTEDIQQTIKNYDVIFNTIPFKLFDAQTLDKMKKQTVLIDLASRPGGVDFLHAEENGITCVWALSLPGKTSPVTAGRIIYRVIRKKLAQ